MAKTFSNNEVEDYYDQTEVHYRHFWKLDKVMGLHYGVWDSTTKSFADAILNTNKQLMQLGEIASSDKVLDAGCGVGGSSIYLAKNLGCKATGITLSKKQTQTGAGFAKREGVDTLVNFEQGDFTNTGFDDDSFTVAWAMESMCHADPKTAFFNEMSRVLKSGGRLVISDFFKTSSYPIEKDKDMLMMFHGWAVPDILSLDEIKAIAKDAGFSVMAEIDQTEAIKKTVNSMYYAYLAGSWVSRLYNLTHKNTTPFAKVHYKTARAQYKAYKKKLWCYHQIAFVKD